MARAARQGRLRGNHPASVDEKGRIKIPSEFLERLRAHGNRFFVTNENGDHVWIFPLSMWEGIEDKLAKLSTHNKARQKFVDRTGYFGQEVELDGQGRLLLPQTLRESAKMTGEVVVLGSINYLKVWNAANFRRERLENSPMTDEDATVLDALGI
jgi:MraZ protein